MTNASRYGLFRLQWVGRVDRHMVLSLDDTTESAIVVAAILGEEYPGGVEFPLVRGPANLEELYLLTGEENNRLNIGRTALVTSGEALRDDPNAGVRWVDVSLYNAHTSLTELIEKSVLFPPSGDIEELRDRLNHVVRSALHITQITERRGGKKRG